MFDEKPDREHLHLAGWLALVSAIMAIPTIIVMALTNLIGHGDFRVVMIVVIAVRAVLFAYVYWTLRNILVQKSLLTKADDILRGLIATKFISVLVVMGIVPIFPGRDFLALLVVLVIVATGILYVLFGIRILRVEEDLHKVLRPLAYALMGTGVLTLTILCVPLATIAGAVADVLVAIVLLKESELLPVAQS